MGKGATMEDGGPYPELSPVEISRHIPVPHYLEQTYWWAYLHPNAVRFFERQWLVNLILWGNFSVLRDAALVEMGGSISGRVLQIACVYGDFSQQVARRLTPDAHLSVVDVAPVQLENLSAKIRGFRGVSLHHQDSTCLSFEDASYDTVIVFFLLHEQPSTARAKTIEEALRVARPGGKVIFVDYHRPNIINPFRYIMIPILSILEPFALGMWQRDILDLVPKQIRPREVYKETFFGGLYQKVVMRP
jgi:ubiquinone/menaquinone biosynthesis C-methylase UbiE